MTEKITSQTGRTYADAFVEILSKSKLLAFTLCTLIIMFLIVHISAEPGSTIELLGVIKYQKAKETLQPKSTPPAVMDETKTYNFPKNEKITIDTIMAIPILDGTIAVKWNRYYLELVGDNISNVKIAVRNLDGTPASTLHKTEDGNAIFDMNTRMEIEYHSRYFAMDVKKVEKSSTALVTVQSIFKPTLKLKPIRELSIDMGDN